MSRPDVVASALRWVGTPYHHQGSVCGAGTDCLGLIRGVWREVCGSEPVSVPPYTQDWAEPQRDEVLWRAARSHLIPLGGPELGAVVLFRMRDGMVAKHLGIMSAVGIDADAAAFVHAYMGHGVVVSPFSAPWKRRAVSYFAFP